MELILLPGNSIYNKAWIEKVRDRLSPCFESTYIHEYRHWKNGGSIDLLYELKALSEHVSNISGNYCVFAKSVGTIITMLACYGYEEAPAFLSPSRSVFLGTAVGMAGRLQLNVDKLMMDIPCGVYFIQQVDDPACAYSRLEGIVQQTGRKDFVLKRIEGCDHKYSDIDIWLSGVVDFMTSSSSEH